MIPLAFQYITPVCCFYVTFLTVVGLQERENDDTYKLTHLHKKESAEELLTAIKTIAVNGSEFGENTGDMDKDYRRKFVQDPTPYRLLSTRTLFPLIIS